MPLSLRNFGHFWSREHVNWGIRGRNNQGDLKGYRIVDRKKLVTDFRDQIGIYVLFGGLREVVYLGQAGASDRKMFLRLRDHTRDHLRDRWSYFSWFGFRKVNQNGELSDQQKPDGRIQGSGGDALDEIEAVLLQLFEPRLNKQGPKWRETEEYLQEVESDHTDPFDEIRKEIANLTAKLEKN
jgi:hypothetical protein